MTSAEYRASSVSGFGLPSSSPWLTCSVSAPTGSCALARQHRIVAVVDVAGHRLHRSDGTQGRQHARASDVACMNDQVDSGEDLGNPRTELPVRIRDQPDAQR